MNPKATAEDRRRAIPEDDPAWQAALNAPIDAEPETDQEREAVEAAKAEMAAGGPTYSQTEVSAMISERREREG